MLIQISSHTFCRAERINGCQILKREDECYEVSWFTDDGEFKSDVFPGRVAAANYIKGISEEMRNNLVVDPDFEEDDED